MRNDGGAGVREGARSVFLFRNARPGGCAGCLWHPRSADDAGKPSSGTGGTCGEG